MDIKKIKLDFKNGIIEIYSTPLDHLLKTFMRDHQHYDVKIYEDDED